MKSGRIFKSLKHLADREALHVGNVLCNPSILVSAHYQVKVFWNNFQQVNVFVLYLTSDGELSDRDCSLYACFSLEELPYVVKYQCATRHTTPRAESISNRLLQQLNHNQTFLSIYNSFFETSILSDSRKLSTIIHIRNRVNL